MAARTGGGSGESICLTKFVSPNWSNHIDKDRAGKLKTKKKDRVWGSGFSPAVSGPLAYAHPSPVKSRATNRGLMQYICGSLKSQGTRGGSGAGFFLGFFFLGLLAFSCSASSCAINASAW